ncbi:MAG: preprotein translocase subunit SecG [Roseibium sp.]|uniref:preprotein translocase subunit SecG n=1 Tax=Roseibium sp. TaxID=1936156 RepID=UPI001B0DFE53|nr:preprotein translocase subunit SecG [Roseibium sp.]MBO6511253.1 preprotein translocase subunit SecG [Roseibium sp.]MBO6893027.1 preprotein translocase subunit SecG [Roseibium sp.]MBO6932646.1 preprotein translocase subunit SecG [Roseibium sp.]
METVVIVIHLMVVLALVLVVLLQRSEGGALGMGGGGGGGGGLMSSRGTANILTRATAVLAVAFFATSLTLSLIAKNTDSPASILDAVPAATDGAPATTEEGTEGGSGGILDQLKPQEPTGPQVPAAQ